MLSPSLLLLFVMVSQKQVILDCTMLLCDIDCFSILIVSVLGCRLYDSFSPRVGKLFDNVFLYLLFLPIF